MSKTKESTKTAPASAATAEGSKKPWDAVDSLGAIIETELATVDAIGTESSGRPELTLPLQYSLERKRPGRPALVFQSESAPGSVGQAAAIAADGKRTAVLLSGERLKGGRLDKCQGVPFQAAFMTSNVGGAFAPGFFKLCARDARQASDFALIGRRTAENSLVPSMLLIDQNGAGSALELLQPLSSSDIESYLGLAGDSIDSPTDYQKEQFGAKRNRVPGNGPSLQRSRLLGDLRSELSKSLEQFKSLTGRSYEVVDSDGVDNSKSVIVAAGALYDRLRALLGAKKSCGLLHPNLIYPFPGDVVAGLLKGKQNVIVCVNSDSPEEEQLFGELQAAFDRAMANGVAAETKTNQPHADYPAYTKVTDRPRLFSCNLSGNVGASDVTAMVEAIEGNNFKEWHFRLSGGDESSGSTKSDATNLIYRASDVQVRTRKLMENLQSFFGIASSAQATAQGERARLSLGTNRQSSDDLNAPADLLIYSANNYNQLPGDLAAVKEGGALLLSGDSAGLGRIWSGIGEESRQLILSKKMRLFLLQADVEPSDKGNVLSEEGVCAGGLLKICSAALLNNKPESEIEAALNMASANGELQFARSIRFGLHNIEEIPGETLASTGVAPVTRRPLRDLANVPTGSSPGADEINRRLAEFYFGGRQAPVGLAPNPGNGWLPAHLYPYQNLSHIRYEYPLVLVESGGEEAVVPLKDLIQRAIDNAKIDDKGRERFQRDLYRLEVKIKENQVAGSSQTLAQAWDRAAEQILSESKMDESKKAIVSQNLQSAKSSLKVKGKVIDCDSSAPSAIFNHLWSCHCRNAAAENMLARAQSLRTSLATILGESQSANSGIELSGSAVASFEKDLDFSTMSKLLPEQAAGGSPVEESRRERIRHAVIALARAEELFTAAGNQLILSGDVTRGVGQLKSRLASYVSLYKAARIGELEINNAFSDDRHASYFADFGPEHLSPEETSAMLATPVVLNSDELNGGGRQLIEEIVALGLPIKVLLVSSGICSGLPLTTQHGSNAGLAFNLAGLLPINSGAYLAQGSLATPVELAGAIQNGLKRNGPAVIQVFTANGNGADINQYLVAAAACESRLFPLWSYDPSAGDSDAERISIEGNIQPENNWPALSFEYDDEDGVKSSCEVGFTMADLALTDSRFASQMMVVPRSWWQDNMVPVAQFLAKPVEDRHGQFPFVHLANRDGILHRAIVSNALLSDIEATGVRWNRIQALAGVNDSHLNRRLEAARSKLAEEKKQELKELEEKFQAEYDRAVGELSEEIVNRIAAGMLNIDVALAPGASTMSAPRAAATAGSTAPAVEAAPEAEETAAPAEEEEEAVSFDEAFIDEPLCTSCNECIVINDRMFVYNDNKQAFIKDVSAGTFKELVEAAEKCPVDCIHPGKPANPEEPGLEDLIKRAEKYN